MADRLRKQLDLMRDLDVALGTESVDVVVLNDTTLPLRYVVVRDGFLLCECDRQKRIAFEVSTRREFWDFEPHLKVYQTALRRRIEAGDFGG